MTTKLNLLNELKMHALMNGFKLNKNERLLDGILDRLLENERTKGELYCPCRLISGNLENDKKIICPCEYHLDEIKKQGCCHCRLFIKSDINGTS